MLGSSTIGNAALRLRASISVSVRAMPSMVTTNSTTPAMMATREMICGAFRRIRLTWRVRADVFGDQPLDDDRVAPSAVELCVFFVDADLPEADRLEQPAAGGVFHE